MNAIASPWLNLEIDMLNHAVDCYSAVKENECYCITMAEPRDWHAESTKSDRGGEILYGISFFFLYDISYMWNLKRNDTNKLTKQKEWINVYAFEVCNL